MLNPTAFSPVHFSAVGLRKSPPRSGSTLPPLQAPRLLDQVRCEMALALLKEREMTLSELAFRLGYSDLRPFARAFKRWTGTTPGSYRTA